MSFPNMSILVSPCISQEEIILENIFLEYCIVLFVVFILEIKKNVNTPFFMYYK